MPTYPRVKKKLMETEYRTAQLALALSYAQQLHTVYGATYYIAVSSHAIKIFNQNGPLRLCRAIQSGRLCFYVSAWFNVVVIIIFYTLGMNLSTLVKSE